jgi:hypothetical protein
MGSSSSIPISSASGSRPSSSSAASSWAIRRVGTSEIVPHGDPGAFRPPACQGNWLLLSLEAGLPTGIVLPAGSVLLGLSVLAGAGVVLLALAALVGILLAKRWSSGCSAAPRQARGAPPPDPSQPPGHAPRLALASGASPARHA